MKDILLINIADGFTEVLPPEEFENAIEGTRKIESETATTYVDTEYLVVVLK